MPCLGHIPLTHIELESARRLCWSGVEYSGNVFVRLLKVNIYNNLSFNIIFKFLYAARRRCFY